MAVGLSYVKTRILTKEVIGVRETTKSTTRGFLVSIRTIIGVFLLDGLHVAYSRVTDDSEIGRRYKLTIISTHFLQGREKE